MELTLQPWGFLPVYLHVVHADEAECDGTPNAGAACEPQVHDEALYGFLEQLCESRWVRVEDGLWLRSTPLPLLDDCFIEAGDGSYRRFGDDEDFVKIVNDMGKGVAVANADTMTMRVIKPGQPVEVQPMKPGVRYVRCYPDLLGILALGGHISLLDAAWRNETGKRAATDMQAQLVLSIVRSRGYAHVSFW